MFAADLDVNGWSLTTTAICGAILAVYGVWRRILRPKWHALSDRWEAIEQHTEAIAHIASELKPNGGGSVKDHVTQIAETCEGLKRGQSHQVARMDEVQHEAERAAQLADTLSDRIDTTDMHLRRLTRLAFRNAVWTRNFRQFRPVKVDDLDPEDDARQDWNLITDDPADPYDTDGQD